VQRLFDEQEMAAGSATPTFTNRGYSHSSAGPSPDSSRRSFAFRRTRIFWSTGIASRTGCSRSATVWTSRGPSASCHCLPPRSTRCCWCVRDRLACRSMTAERTERRVASLPFRVLDREGQGDGGTGTGIRRGSAQRFGEKRCRRGRIVPPTPAFR
jgi:hypothetical protein